MVGRLSSSTRTSTPMSAALAKPFTKVWSGWWMARLGKGMPANSWERSRAANRAFEVGLGGESPHPRAHCYGIGQAALCTSFLTSAPRRRCGGSFRGATRSGRTSNKSRAHNSSEAFELLGSTNSIHWSRPSAHSLPNTSRLHPLRARGVKGVLRARTDIESLGEGFGSRGGGRLDHSLRR